MIEKKPGYYFNYETWRNGSLQDFGIYQRLPCIKLNRKWIQKYALYFCKAEHCWYKPKLGYVGVRFFYKGLDFWTHLTKEEFLECFPEME